MTALNSILVTGGAGFIGSNFIPYFLNKHQHYRIINLDKLSYAADLSNLQEIENHPRYEFIQGDICDNDLVKSIFNKYDIRGIINFAAESHVDNSIASPDIFIQTNIVGAFNLLDTARQQWMESAHKHSDGYEECRFHHISTDEVYGSLGQSGKFTETTPYTPNSPYSASKASADMIVRSYYHTYGLNVVTSNCSNNYGPKQHQEKLIPTIIFNALNLKPIPIYGDGKNVRDWIYVLDHCKGIDAVYHSGKSGETYNIGSRNERDNLHIAHTVCAILDEIAVKNRRAASLKSYSDLITFVPDRPGHDRRYAIDPTKIETELGWKAEVDFQTGLRQTIEWYMERIS
ncbi:MAG: dTDP-glucose 4,6-dehydratase [Dehalococcoidia bacterium]|nr:dTDP-glucose 4,6-dehydratase [Dehalococcoidia bacterium]